ncbi:TetR/AcrR family transcriptional regulator [Ensifer adhaerens]|uniref:TetR/AcrR family transcriptional regulator n=1 Tax=Ensifer adhaerens TaxID=106592 RepID=UPI001CBB7069|nr:TetR/AcrR family transcriptional regulator [Ensifer adhaerens]MBZ7924176.1 TetR/AcrR family transcriptional regulator [Ensifer adhaerens]UAX96566.1 TetR/AcrR family transcriptional regulator [Ensifer adhaerens]UAY04090.1 TetR/AcrR family transcriptional regulator [Ensifer adhaerens]UAY12076.1 TetR/AcrR family transcriptional regulator [Ensifer adhaerens]
MSDTSTAPKTGRAVDLKAERHRSPKGEEVEKTKRLPPAQREEFIVREAVRFFAEFGFEGQTRELAKRLQITQPLLYRYFPTKDALIERVYDEVFLRRWNPFWEEEIARAGRPLIDRLTSFYQDYSKVILTYEWVRLFTFAGLKGLDFNTRYLNLLNSRIFRLVIAELRSEFGRPGIDVLDVTEMEVEAIWSLHASIFYLGVRKHIYHMPVHDIPAIVSMQVSIFLNGVDAIIGKEN